MGSLTDRLAALEAAAVRREQVAVPEMSPEEATRRYMEWRSMPVCAFEDSPFAGVPPERHIELYLELIGAGAGRVPKGRG